MENTPAKIHAVIYGKYTQIHQLGVFPTFSVTNTPNWCIFRGLALAVQRHERDHIECSYTPPRGGSCLAFACYLLHWSCFDYLAGCVAVEPLDVARSKDLTNTPNWVYFGVFPVDLGALHVVVRAVVVLCRKSGGAVLRTPFLPRCRAARDLAGPLRPVVAWGQASGPSRPITPIQCIVDCVADS